MNLSLDLSTHPIPNHNTNPTKPEQQTAVKPDQSTIDQNQSAKIRNFVFSLFKTEKIRGHVKVQNFESLETIEIILFHKIDQYKVQEKLRLTFTALFPKEPPSMLLHSCNLTNMHPQYSLPNFLAFHHSLTHEKWSQEVVLADVIAEVYQNINNFHKSQVARLMSPAQVKLEGQEEHMQEQQQRESVSIQRLRKQRRKNSSMTGCADKELTQTKNLNRHFRSKLREVLRDLESTSKEHSEDAKGIDSIFTPNRVGFEDIRKALSNKWFNEGVRRQMSSGQFLHKILRGMMGIKSKKLMIKYYHVMVSAVEEPSSFIRWKYD